MKKHLPVYVTALLFVFAPILRGQQKEALRLVQTIPMPNVKRRIDQPWFPIRSGRKGFERSDDQAPSRCRTIDKPKPSNTDEATPAFRGPAPVRIERGRAFLKRLASSV